jgi:hypothetical protein
MGMKQYLSSILFIPSGLKRKIIDLKGGFSGQL